MTELSIFQTSHLTRLHMRHIARVLFLRQVAYFGTKCLPCSSLRYSCCFGEIFWNLHLICPLNFLQGELVFANTGTRHDLEILRNNSIDLTGKILLVKYGFGSLYSRVRKSNQVILISVYCRGVTIYLNKYWYIAIW